VRLRLLPSSPETAREVGRRAEQALNSFLERRPALYEVKSEFLVELYNTLFELEYPPEERARHSDDDGRMVLRRNNSVRPELYEPEFGKYGGPAGVALAEWHFTRSSELAVDALGRMNMHVRTVMLGVAAQLMMVVSSSFIDDRPQLTDYLQRYHDFWHNAFAGKDIIADGGYDKNYDRMAERVGTKFTEMHDAISTGQHDRIPGFLGEWAAHCTELRARVDALATAGDLTFRSWDGTRDETLTDPLHARQRLLSPYMHMTNNRLNATMRDEAYLSYVLARVLRESGSESEPQS
jgi:thiopeptide-type bacteriocin biosynthesis protein